MAERSSQKKDLETPVQYIKGIGPRRAAVLDALAIRTVRDILYYFPRGYIDLSRVETIANLRRQMGSGQLLTVIGTVRRLDLLGRPPKQRFVLTLGDGTGTIPLVFFHGVKYFKSAFTEGETLAVSGEIGSYAGRPQIIHPSIDRLGEPDTGEGGFLHTRGIVPKYSSSEELRNVRLETRSFRRILKVAVDEYLPGLTEYLPRELLKRNGLVGLQSALRSIHFPESHGALAEARRRLKFDELFSLQLFLALRRRRTKTDLPGIAFGIESALARSLVDSLPFKLTGSQIRVIREITGDMRSPKPMNRLLQGDVGSGKTVVALVAMLIAIDSGYQTAFMAPTEILAEQHLKTLRSFLGGLPVNIRLLVSGQGKRLREDVLTDVSSGAAQIVVGTHALIQEGVEFARLGFIVIDEQHRFGVAQRVTLREKGTRSQGGVIHPDIMVMTATPIPRTLSLTLYGDLDVSTISELPAGRRPIRTLLRTESQRGGVYAFLREEVAKGRQVYVVYPLIEESEKLDLKAATEGYEMLRGSIFQDLRLGLIHGRLPSEEKEAVMSAFKARELDILVSTTVIEVGIDVPTATVMVIEHAERFGLSQLHQLRGRVGRGADQSHCVLMAPDWLGRVRGAQRSRVLIDGETDERQIAERRLAAMLETTDGFKIAEIDLNLRGPGDFFGTRQSGLPELQLANLLTDGDILTLARSEALTLIERDPHLRASEHEEMRKHFQSRMSEMFRLTEVG